MSEVMNKQFRSDSPTISFKSMQVSETQVGRVAASTMHAVRIRTLKSYTYAEFMLPYFMFVSAPEIRCQTAQKRVKNGQTAPMSSSMPMSSYTFV